MNIACLQNHPMEGPAAIGEWLGERGYSLQVFEGFSGNFPVSDDFDVLLIMGGSMSVNDADEDAFVGAAIETTRAFLDAGKPILGICLGAQMLAAAAGGNVIEGPEKEIGWYPITVRSEPEGHLLSEVPNEMVVFHWHGDQIELPPEATLLASTSVCPVQAFQLNPDQLGLQCHFEVTEESIEKMLDAFETELLFGGPGVETAVEIRDGFSRFGGSCRESLDQILDRWSGSFSV